MDPMIDFINEIQHLLMRPFKVLLICAVLGLLAIVYDGSLYRYWSLKQTETELSERISQIQNASQTIKSQIEQTKTSRFIERQARERLDLVGEDEMVFVFSNEN